jgi:hypothetical protein
VKVPDVPSVQLRPIAAGDWPADDKVAAASGLAAGAKPTSDRSGAGGVVTVGVSALDDNGVGAETARLSLGIDAKLGSSKQTRAAAPATAM